MSNKVQKRVGKAQARDELSTLIDAVNSGAGAIEITDYGKVTAVLLSEKQYEWLCACAKKHAHPKREARGVVLIADENALDDAAKVVASDIEESIRKTASLL
ncbi:MAG TPA: type II toxin-antitoxin system prevent-host-death family antitoxin [Drouetiella sp.]